MSHSPILHINNTETGKHKALSAANIYRMLADLKFVLNKMRDKLTAEQYQDMYAKLLHLNTSGILKLHKSLKAGKLNKVRNFLKNKAAHR